MHLFHGAHMILSRCTVAILLAVGSFSMALAHHPDRARQPVKQRVDVIPPLGNQLKMSHRREFNRPSKLLGKISYYIAPTSQEAMAWHRAEHKGYYDCDQPRTVTHYFSPKPWEVLTIGARPAPNQKDSDDQPENQSTIYPADELALPADTITEPLATPGMIE